MKWQRLRPILLLPILFLSACQTVSSNAIIVCPIIKEYSAQQQKLAVKEFAEVRKKYPEITRYIVDYADLRRKVRICQRMQ